MNLWLVIGLPLLFLVGVFYNAFKEMKRLEKELPRYKDKIRPPAEFDDPDERH
ncbi:MAG: hypothetical protein ACRCYV_03045 [Aeromonas sp.]